METKLRMMLKAVAGLVIFGGGSFGMLVAGGFSGSREMWEETFSLNPQEAMTRAVSASHAAEMEDGAARTVCGGSGSFVADAGEERWEWVGD